ncbi:cupin domain-containing protein [Amphritea sp. 2_MG-2023]|uniref:cupin domain-containing protein n=1 Tax=Amphritea TaxID=515417 RepID=UPI001C064C15|nr:MULTISPECIES: cupin domain-containing protein [Amphritea]MBU2966772.1 cupin domain-containing protein [Amphritea atlantica]MDO6418961.1 cupin domain-containing protein [Amphritea sp. 2_MG-2023]
MKIINTENAERYKWGINSIGWHLLKSDSLSVIEEEVPPNEKEERHYHNESQQFFYVLSGVAHIEISGNIVEINSGSGIHVPAQEPHQLMNNGTESLRFLVISQPKSHGDRVNAEPPTL